jgi:hypothetical protein
LRSIFGSPKTILQTYCFTKGHFEKLEFSTKIEAFEKKEEETGDRPQLLLKYRCSKPSKMANGTVDPESIIQGSNNYISNGLVAMASMIVISFWRSFLILGHLFGYFPCAR